MKTVQKSLKLSTADYYATHFSIINGLIPQSSRLTPREIEVLALFMSIPVPQGIPRFNPATKKHVKATLSLSDSGLSQHLKHLVDKGILYFYQPPSLPPTSISIPQILMVREVMLPDPDSQDYQFRLINDPDLNPPLIPTHPLPQFQLQD